MIWLQPWLWLAVAGVALPALIHLLGRGRARVLRFPSLRFVAPSRLLPTKRSRIQDPLLLAVRCAIVALAAAALAQPLVLTNGRRRALDRGLARAVIVDTSASVRRTSLDSARQLGRRLADEAPTSIVIETGDPGGSVGAAANWVAHRERRGEIAIVSDFQRGQIERGDLAPIPAAIGVALHRVGARSGGAGVSAGVNASVDATLAENGRVIVARATIDGAGANVSWTSPGGAAAAPPVPVEVLAPDGARAAVAAVETAAAAVAVPLPIDTTRAIAVVTAGWRERDALIARLAPPRLAWQRALLATLRRDGLPFAAAGDASLDGGAKRFVIVTDADAASLATAQIVALARRATSAAPPVTELNPATVPDSTLRAWERAPAPASSSQYRPDDENGPSDARWVWLAVLVLLAVEWRLRRQTASAPARDAEEPARAA